MKYTLKSNRRLCYFSSSTDKIWSGHSAYTDKYKKITFSSLLIVRFIKRHRRKISHFKHETLKVVDENFITSKI
jgi:hypothetical protein